MVPGFPITRLCHTSTMNMVPAVLAALAVVVAALIGLAGVYVGWLLRRKDQIRQEEREDACFGSPCPIL